MPSLDTLMSYHRLKREPLDDSEIFNSLADLMDYCENGACYNGQRVTVREGGLTFEYIIKKHPKYTPIVNMNGSEPIFKNIKFTDDNNESKSMLIFADMGVGSEPIVSVYFSFNENYMNLLSQIEIFRLINGGNKTFKFKMEATNISTGNFIETFWELEYANTENQSPPITTSNYISDIAQKLQEYLGTGYSNKYITKIYIKANDYYDALNS